MPCKIIPLEKPVAANQNGLLRRFFPKEYLRNGKMNNRMTAYCLFSSKQNCFKLFACFSQKQISCRFKFPENRLFK